MSMNFIKFLATEQGLVFIDGIVNSTEVVSSIQIEFREVHPKSVVIPETIGAVRQIILQDRHEIS